MFFRKLPRFVLPVSFILLGLWLVFRSSGPVPESVARQRAIQAFAPSGVPSDEGGTAVPSAQLSLPVTINLSDIPAGVFDPDNQLSRWNQGEIDIFENDGIISRVEQHALRAVSENLAASDKVQLAPNGPGLFAPTVGVSFDSIDYTECCGPGGGNVPPDPELAVGAPTSPR